MVPLWMIPVAIVCGNTFVLKPSEQVPLSQKLLFELIHEAGFPKGVLNLVHGAKEVVDEFVQGRKNDQIGLVVFGNEAFTQCPLTLDYGTTGIFLRMAEDRGIEERAPTLHAGRHRRG